MKGEYSKEAVRRGMVTALDESVGRILERLRETGHHDNTLVVFASDNGAGEAASECCACIQLCRVQIQLSSLRLETPYYSGCMIFSD